MLLANYASDSESETDDSGPGPSRPVQPLAASKPASATQPAAGAAAPTATAKGKKRGPVRITLDLPKVTADDSEEGNELSKPSRGDSGDEEDRGSKKPKLGGAGLKGGKGSSMLLGMLPPPKRKLPSSSTSKSSSLAVNKSMATRPAVPAPKPVLPSVRREVDDEDEAEVGELDLSNGMDTGMLMPASVARGKVKAAKQDDGLDLFGLASVPAPLPSPSSSKPSLPRPTEITSAPAVADFVPPPPTPHDPYPGYYQLPNGGWAAYDPDYYHSFFPLQPDVQGAGAGESEDDGRLGKHWDELKGREGEVMEFDPTKGIREAREEEERRSKVIKPRMLGDDHEYKEIGQVKGLAAERHQLTSLLSTAYTQRDALEERLQANKKSMRVARTKYGF